MNCDIQILVDCVGLTSTSSTFIQTSGTKFFVSMSYYCVSMSNIEQYISMRYFCDKVQSYPNENHHSHQVTAVLPNLRFRHPIGLLWLPCRGQQSLTATLLLLGYFWLPGREMSWNRAPLWKIVNFLSIQGDFVPFQRQWADLSPIDRIKTSYGATEGDYPQLSELDNLSFFCPVGWFLVNLQPKNAQN